MSKFASVSECNVVYERYHKLEVYGSKIVLKHVLVRPLPQINTEKNRMSKQFSKNLVGQETV